MTTHTNFIVAHSLTVEDPCLFEASVSLGHPHLAIHILPLGFRGRGLQTLSHERQFWREVLTSLQVLHLILVTSGRAIDRLPYCYYSTHPGASTRVSERQVGRQDIDRHFISSEGLANVITMRDLSGRAARKSHRSSCTIHALANLVACITRYGEDVEPCYAPVLVLISRPIEQLIISLWGAGPRPRWVRLSVLMTRRESSEIVASDSIKADALYFLELGRATLQRRISQIFVFSSITEIPY